MSADDLPQGDLSPMLPQPADDNAPMISGRGTKIIAHARGAYLAGNLRALIDLMTEEQISRYRAIVLDQAVTVMRGYLTALGLTDLSIDPSLAALGRLMTAPNAASVAETLACFFHPDRVPEYHAAMLASPVSDTDLSAVAGVVMPFVTIARSTVADGFEMSLWAVLAMAGERLRQRGLHTTHWWAASSITPQQVHAHVQRWLIETVWAILIGKPVPSLDDTARFGAVSMLG